MYVLLGWLTYNLFSTSRRKKKSPLENFVLIFSFLQTWRANQDTWRHLILFTPFQWRKCSCTQNIHGASPCVGRYRYKTSRCGVYPLRLFLWGGRGGPWVSNGKWVLRLEHARVSREHSGWPHSLRWILASRTDSGWVGPGGEEKPGIIPRS